MTWVTDSGDTQHNRLRHSVALLDGNCLLSREALGNKAHGINLMRGLGLSVPPAFCIPTDVCAAFLAGDGGVLGRLDGIHHAVLAVLAVAIAQLPRLDSYTTKLEAALNNIKAGDTTWFTRPIIDSYHTVWFELHEELIAAAGLTREDEAISGHAE